MKPYDFTVQLLNGALRDVEGRVEVHVSSYGCPAKLYGPPERCYPSEGPEFDLGEIEVIVGMDRHPVTGFIGWRYRTLDEADANDKWLADLIRAAIDHDDVATHVLEQQAEERAAAEEAAWEARRDAKWEAA